MPRWEDPSTHPEQETILVTGGSGFIAGHIILQLVERGYAVRTTIRSLAKAEATRQTLEAAGLSAGAPLEFVAADLTSDSGWAEAMTGIDAVLHVASPIHTGKVKDENDVIAPAREGTLRVLRAASRAGIRRLVLTSAFHSVGFGHRHDYGEFTEDDWSVIDNRGVDVYGKSKILAERAAWDFIESDASGMELVVLLPVAVMGPVIGTSVSGADHIVQASLKGKMPGYPRMYIPIVDVRDVAAAQVAAITAPDAAGKRILVANGEPAVAMKEIGAVIREHFGSAASKVPTRSIPDLVGRLAALFSAEYRPVAADLGFMKRVPDKRVREILGVHPRPSKDAVLAAAESMIGTPLV